MLDEFLLNHPNLEHLHLQFLNELIYYSPSIADSVMKLPKLRVLALEYHIMNQGFTSYRPNPYTSSNIMPF